ncbi:MAG: amino acid permease [Lentisphaeria bacterium]|nr:amino acid permease [Lentisphaeria bacterium]
MMQDNRYLSFAGALALSFGYAVGWGAFVLPGSMFLPNAGPAGTIIGFLIGTVAITVLAFNFHKVTTHLQGAGGTYGFITKVFGQNHGFLMGWFLFLTYMAILWANATSLVLLARYLFGGALQFGFHYTMVGFDVYLGEVLLCLAAIVLCACACIAGRRLAIGLHTFFAFVLLAGVVTCFVAALFQHKGGMAGMGPAFSTSGPKAVQILRILAMVPWAFVGFEAVVQSSSEFRFPVKRTFSLLLAAILLAALTYILLALLPTLALPDGYSNWKEYNNALPGLTGIAGMPVFSAAKKALGPLGVAVIGGSMLSGQLTALFATYIAVSRLMRAMADDEMIPQWFGKCNGEGNPVNAILTVMCISLPIPFLGRTVIGWPVDLSNLGAAIAYGYISAAALVIIGKEKGVDHTVEKTAGVFGLAMSIVFSVLMLVPNYLSGSSLSTESYLLLVIWCFVGFLMYRRVFIMDVHGRFGKSTVVWITVLIVIFFSSLMWFRLAVCDSAKDAYGALVGGIVTAETVRKSISHVNTDILVKSALELFILVSSLAVILNLFSILHKRERQYYIEKLKAEENAKRTKDSLIGARLNNQKLAGVNRELREYTETIEKQRQLEAELRKQLEKKQEELEEALQMAQDANRAKTTFLSNMSHDIRTPMNAIIGFTGLAESHIHDTERVQEYLTTISHSSEHLLSLINDILDMSRIESGRMSLHEKEESLSEILHSIRDIVHADIKAKQHNFTIDAVDVRNELVYCDKLRLNQVLLNLISNAIKYTHPGGTITLRIAQKDASRTGYGLFEFRCRDNGIGMSEDFVKTIFDPFTREETTTVSRIHGTGLGMAITRNIVEMMGGRITVASKKGEGTEFVISVEFRIADMEMPDLVIPELKGLRSLVVDNDINACRSIADMLQTIGLRSESCVSGKEAVARTEESLRHGDRFKVYVVDWLMPDANGVETVRRIREVAGAGAFIIILTSYDWTDIEKEAREAGANGFISKPVFPSDLQRVLLQLCGKANPDQTGAEEEIVSLKGKKVLMVDDNELNLKLGTLQLKQQGMIVDTALNGQTAVNMIWENGVDTYDLVLMDVTMPVMDGYEATSIIRKLPGGNKLKILAFSANAFEEDRERSLNAGMDGHIAKPLKVDELLSELKRFVM